MDRDYSQDYYLARARHPMWRIEAAAVRDMAGAAGKGTVLDIGCGCGSLLAALEPRKGIGIDHGAQAVELAGRLNGQYEFRVGDACDLQMPARSLDCIVHMHLIEHLTDPAAAVKAWHAALAVGGRVVLTTPNGSFSHPECYDDPDHKHIFKGPELAELFASAGFRVLRVFTLGSWGVRHWPMFWRLQPLCAKVRWPGVAGLRWRGQTLCLSAEKRGEA